MPPLAPGAGMLPGGWACHLACTIVAWGSLPPGAFWTCTCDTSSPALLWWWMWSPPGPPWHFVLRMVGWIGVVWVEMVVGLGAVGKVTVLVDAMVSPGVGLL